MDLATTMSVIQTILTAIQTLHQLKAMFSCSDFERKLADLQNTINYVKAVLEDAETKQDALNSQEKFYIEELKDAVYDVDDVLDEFLTLVKQKQLTKASDKFFNKVSSFLSRFRHLTFNLSRKVKEVNKKLENIASKSSNFCFKIETKPIKFINPDTSSLLSAKDPIIGRGEDLEKIVEMLLGCGDVHQQNDVSSLAIVGMGGLGKTALARLVFNDPRITSEFEQKSWICIGDQDQWNLTHLLRMIVGHKDDSASLEQIHHEIRKQLERKKYMLVLDDVWTECYHEWQELEKYLMIGKSGSRIIVTTRSKKTARIIGGVRVHELQGLSDNVAWLLFERMAFRAEQRGNHDEDFVRLGKDIAKKCFNVPLAIRVVASLLRDESKPKWLSFRDKELANIAENDDTINKILSLSYHRLNSSLKSCFVYCAIFPKDFEINKQILISLWMAQGYINVESVGEEYFCILLQRCFFQDVEEDESCEITFVKIHDLLHDIAEKAAGKEVCSLNSYPSNVERKIHHLSLLNGFYRLGTSNKTHIRTCFQVNMNGGDHLLANNLIAKLPWLRSLDLSYLLAERLPESIGKLFHLRYLNLQYSKYLKVLPNSITKLVNLQTLNLLRCCGLEELPRDVYKLVDLSTLNITDCNKLSHIPSKMVSLTGLHTLGHFVIGGRSSYEQPCFSGLEVLLRLNNLRGSLKINIDVCKNTNYMKKDHGGGAYLISKIHLQKIHINFTNKVDESIVWEQALLEEMQPHEDIRKLTLERYNGEKMPRWPRMEDNSTLFYFPNLVKLKFWRCQQLQYLPSLEMLPRLKKLELGFLPNIEYVVNVNLEECTLPEGTTFFPCLHQIKMIGLPKLKGWWLRSVEQNEQLIGEPLPGFGQVKKLVIEECLMLKSIPICPSLNSVWMHGSDITMEQLPPNFKCLLPSESKSKIISTSYLEALAKQ